MSQTSRKPDPAAQTEIERLRECKALHGAWWTCGIVDGQGRVVLYPCLTGTTTTVFNAAMFLERSAAEDFAERNPVMLGKPSPHITTRVETVAEACDREIASIERANA